MDTKRPLLTISLLISNRLDTIPRCLDSLKPIMDALPCELILIDTSKNAEIKKILHTYTDQVYEFEWCNDFAKARNEGVKRASGEWFMFLDDDEWFVEVEELITFFKSGEYKEYGFANYLIRNFMDEKQIQYADTWVSRLVRLGQSVKFVGKVHEYFVPVINKSKDLNVHAYHTGYVHETAEKREAHFERNYKLLQEMISEEPRNFRWHLQLVQEYVTVDKWEELVRFCEECLDFISDENRDEICIHIGTFYDGLTRGLYAQKKYTDSIKACKRALEDERVKEVVTARMYFRLAENFFCIKEYAQAIYYAEEYLKLSRLDLKQNIDLFEQTKAILIGDVFDEKYIKPIYNILVCSQLEKGNLNYLIENYDRLGWNQKVIYSIDDVEKYIVKALWENDYHSIFLRIMVDVLGNKKLSENFRKEILNQGKELKNDFQGVVYLLNKATQVLIDGPREGDMLAYHKALGEYVNAICDWNDFIELQGGFEIENENALGYLQAAINISEYYQTEKQNPLEALHYLKAAVEVLPEIATGVGVFLDAYTELDKQRVEKQKKELEELRIQVMCQAKAMIDMGQSQSAKQIIDQLMLMFPNDVEVEALAAILKK